MGNFSNRIKLASKIWPILAERDLPHNLEGRGAIPGLGLLLQEAVSFEEIIKLTLLEDTQTDFGRAISPAEAATLLFSSSGWTRTRKLTIGFWDAAWAALKANPNDQVHVLYIGTGPYASLALPVAAAFPQEKLVVHAVDIHQESLDMLDRVLRHFDLEETFPTRLCADATQVDWHKHLTVKPKIVLVECMDRALLREPQAKIVENLNQQYGSDFLLVPGRVMVNVYLYGEDGRIMENFPFFFLDSSGVVGRGADYSGSEHTISKEFSWEDLEQGATERVHFSLETIVRVGPENILSDDENAITREVYLPALPSGTKKARISYRLGCEPRDVRVEAL
ncbi:MAG: hypothetical protein AAB383_02170 [Patescibacteria group bacterium]